MNFPIWLEPDFLIIVHGRILVQFGGGSGIRDRGRIDAALNRPRIAFDYEAMHLPSLSACYASAIIQGHPFIDGNKRTAFVAAVTFLELNGKNFIADEVEAAEQTLALANGKLSELGYAQWLAISIH